MIHPHDCVSPVQDSLHGKGRRVMNVAGKGTKLRCTVCLKEVQLSGVQIKDAKKSKEKK